MSSGYTQAQLDEMKKNYALGIASVTEKDRTVTFRSLAEMERIISEVEADLARAAGTPKVRAVRVVTSKGV